MSIRLAKTPCPPALRRRRQLLQVLASAAELCGLQHEDGVLQVCLLSKKRMAELNELFLGHQGPTDVLSFDLRQDARSLPGDEPPVIAEIDVCPAVALEYAAEHGGSPSRELVLYIVHGMLHLVGEDDQTRGARRAMRAAEKRVMDALGQRYDLEAFI
jgi:probable rRNA maturation factor